MTNEEFEELNCKYDELMERLIKGAEFMDNPLIKPEVYDAAMDKYNRICDELEPIRREYWNHVLRREGLERESEQQVEVAI